ncbi:MAG: lysophospholipid acyltransferase family protein [Flavobacteriales bacterium]|nr:lysophospholipid acyltransferase family protein [Flavobacteriales bacterium]
MQKLWYANVRFWVKLAIKLFYRRIEIHGFDQFPEQGPVLLAPNHQNAFMDALIPAVFAPRPIHFLVRSDVFKKGFVKWFLNSLNMMPVYRQRDGISNLAKNEEVFEMCFEILRNKGTLLIFPEAGHLGERRLRPLSKGFTRIVFGALEKHEHLDIKIVPLGLNYSNYQDSQSRLLINFGNPIPVKAYQEAYNQNAGRAMTELRANLQSELEKQIIHIDGEQAQKAIDIEMDRLLPFYLQRAGGYSQPQSQHQFYKNREKFYTALAPDDQFYKRIGIYDHTMGKYKLRAPFFYINQVFLLAWLVHAPTYFTIRFVLSRFVADKAFYSSIKLVGTLLLFPIFGILFAVAGAMFTGRPILVAGFVVVFFPVSIFIIRELRLPYRYTFTMWRMLVMKFRNKSLIKYLKEIEREVIQSFNR